MINKYQTEKERHGELFKERINEYENRVKKLESEKQRSDLDHSRALREKEGVID